jgi:uncharacterized protein (DUF934 family)
MPLIKDGRFTADDWLRLEPGVTPPAGGNKLLLPLDRLEAEGGALADAGNTLGVEIANHVAPDVLAPWLARLGVVSILFPKSADGRGFSLARRLRRMGFEGELRATGHVIPDQYALALSCGFDTVEISEALAVRQPETHWRESSRAMSWAYQTGSNAQRSILAARWRSLSRA